MLRLKLTGCSIAFVVLFSSISAGAHSVGQAGTVQGTVTDQSGAVIVNATVTLRNILTDYRQVVNTNGQGAFSISNVPPNPYRLEVASQGFETYQQDVEVRTSVPNHPQDIFEDRDHFPYHQRPGIGERSSRMSRPCTPMWVRKFLSKLPVLSPSSGLSDAITLTTPGVVADSNGFFHPQGDHAQTLFSIDGQPIGDQQSKLYSTQIPVNAIASMELITGAPGAAFGGKTSLVVNAVTQSGLGKAKPFGSLALQYGSFGTPSEEASLGWGTARYGNFIVANTSRSGRFLDSPEFLPIHDVGNSQTLFDHFDFKPNDKNLFHLNLMGARNWFQIPDSYDQIGQDQRQKAITFNVSPSYQHIFTAKILMNVNSFFRQDQVSYYPSRNPFADQPATIAQARRLTNFGFKGDVSYVNSIHNVKIGTQIMRTRLREHFNFGITDPGFNAVCVDSAGNPQTLPGITSPSLCAGLGLVANPNLQPGLVPYDLTRGGTLFNFFGRANIDEFAFYAQDIITIHGLTLSPGLRIDRYDGLSQATGVEPRIGLSYLVRPSSSVLRLSYSRTLETPYNENLVLSSSTGVGGLATNVFGAFGDQPLKPGSRNQFNAGLQQSFGRYFIFDGDYVWKYTTNGYDFDALFNTPITFPIAWRKSKIDGVSLRFGTTNVHGLQAFTTMGHTRARFYPPELGGLIFNSPLDTQVFRIDHDQAFQQTSNVRYQRPNNGPWFSFTWRYDSGEVAGAVTSLSDALGLTAAQQAAIGFFCGNQTASLGSPITSCSGLNYGATRLVIPAPGTFNPDTNPPRVASRHLIDLGIGTDNLFRSQDNVQTGLKFTVVNLTNKVALYNFLSTFSGTHFVQPRTYQAEIRISF